MDLNKKFYEFSFLEKRGEVFAKLEKEYDDFSLMTGNFSFEKICEAKVYKGNKAFDIIRLQDPFNFSISNSVRQELIDNKIDGWKTYDIKIKGIDQEYHGFQVIGKCGKPHTPNESGVVNGFTFDINSWDGSEIFCPQDMAMIICTEKVKNVFESLKIPTVEFEELSTLEWWNAGN